MLPLPGLTASELPITIEDDLTVDIFTEAEAEACATAGILTPAVPDTRLLKLEECIGVRIALDVPSRVEREGLDAEARSLELAQQQAAPHRFGQRSHWKWPDLAEDVLSILRLVSSEFVGSKGSLLLHPGGTGRSWVTRPTRNIIHTSLVLDQASQDKLVALWRAARSTMGQRLPQICLRRFNAAIDRITPEDIVIDHLIAAEALLLKDSGRAEDKGELSFRLSLRGSLLLERAARAKRQSYKFLRSAYTMRSRISHGEVLPTKVRITGRGDVELATFLSELAEIMRDALRLGLEGYSSDPAFETAEFWEDLILGSDGP